jgi:signal transduction histidine kinase
LRWMGVPAVARYRRSMGPIPRRWHTLLAALLSACWAAGFLLAEGAVPAVLLGGSLGLAVLALRRLPLVGGVAVAIVVAAGNVFGVPADSAWSLPGWLIALYVVGRYSRATGPGVAVGMLLWAALVWAEPTLPTLLFGAVLTAVPLALGRGVAQRSALAERAAQRHRELATVDVEARAGRVVAEERARLAADVLDVLRSSVVSVRGHAAPAAADLDTSALAAIEAEGRHATTELRRLLGLLRSEPTEQATGEPGSDAAVPARPTIRGRVALAVGLVVLLVLETIAAALDQGLTVGPTALAACLLLVAAAVVRDRQPTASLVAALAPTTGFVLDLELPYGLWSAIAAVLVVWSVAMTRSWPSYTAAGVFAALFLAEVHRHAPGNEAMTLVTLVLAAIVGSVWSSRTRMERRASAEASVLQAHHDAVAERAMRQERLQLARELHDVASHAVGVMVLQAGAAQALRADRPDRSHQAVATIQVAAADALDQLDRLVALLEAGTVGTAGLATPTAHTDLADDLARLAGRMRTAGMVVDIHMVGDMPTDTARCVTIYRIVQEALTNAMRHASGSQVTITLRSGDGYELEIEDDGPHGDVVASSGAASAWPAWPSGSKRSAVSSRPAPAPTEASTCAHGCPPPHPPRPARDPRGDRRRSGTDPGRAARDPRSRRRHPGRR